MEIGTDFIRGSHYSLDSILLRFFPFHGDGDGINFALKIFFDPFSVGIDINFAWEKKKKFLSVGENFFRLSGLGRINTASKNFLPLLINFFPSQRALNLFLILLSLVRSTRSKEKIGSNYLDEFELEFFEDRGGNIYIYIE